MSTKFNKNLLRQPQEAEIKLSLQIKALPDSISIHSLFSFNGKEGVVLRYGYDSGCMCLGQVKVHRQLMVFASCAASRRLCQQ